MPLKDRKELRDAVRLNWVLREAAHNNKLENIRCRVHDGNGHLQFATQTSAGREVHAVHEKQ